MKYNKSEIEILAKQMVELEWGSEQQVKAETHFFEFMAKHLPSKKYQALEEFCQGATTDEMTDYGLRLLSQTKS